MQQYSIHDILNINTNVKGLLPESFLDPKKVQGKNHDLSIIKDNHFPISNSLTTIGPALFYDETDNSIITKFSFMGIESKIKLKNLSSQNTVIYFNQSYSTISKHILKIPISSLYPINHLIKLVIQIKLLQKNHSFLIGAGLKIGKHKIIISGFGNMGKTQTTLKLLEKTDTAQFLSEDTLITDGKTVFSYPQKMRIRKGKNLILNREKHLSSDSLIKNKSIKSFAPSHIFILERNNKEKFFSISKRETYHKISSINKKTNPYLSERLILATQYVNSKFDLDKLISKENTIIKSLTSRSKGVILQTNNNFVPNYSQLLQSCLKIKN